MLGSLPIVASLSDIPFGGPCATTQINCINSEFVCPNPGQKAWAEGDFTAC